MLLYLCNFVHNCMLRYGCHIGVLIRPLGISRVCWLHAENSAGQELGDEAGYK